MAPASTILNLPLTADHLPTTATPAIAATTTNTVNAAIISPVVLFSIIDSYIRREETQNRVIGALLGVRNDQGDIVEIRNCFPIPHGVESSQSEAEDMDEQQQGNHPIQIDIEYARTMYQLHRRVNNREVVVGWFSAGSNGQGQDLSQPSAALHDWFESNLVNVPSSSSMVASSSSSSSATAGGQSGVFSASTATASHFKAIHLVVDPELKGDSFGVQSFIGLPVGGFSASDATKGRIFVPVITDVKFFDAERTGLNVISQAAHSTDPNNPNASGILKDIDNLEVAIVQIISMVESVSNYIQETLAKGGNISAVEKQKMDKVAKYLLDIVGSVPKIDSEKFEKQFNAHLQDLLMVVYLSNLARSQMDIANKLRTSIIS